MEQIRDIRSRAPKAKNPRKTVLLRLDEGEFSALEGMAKKEERSRSNMARLLYLRGLAEIKNEMQKGES
ncbi:hypothetical protein CR770_14380 [Salmonella enterica]|nr:hypothetical protein [Salmonella enterica]